MNDQNIASFHLPHSNGIGVEGIAANHAYQPPPTTSYASYSSNGSVAPVLQPNHINTFGTSAEPTNLLYNMNPYDRPGIVPSYTHPNHNVAFVSGIHSTQPYNMTSYNGHRSVPLYSQPNHIGVFDPSVMCPRESIDAARLTMNGLNSMTSYSEGALATSNFNNIYNTAQVPYISAAGSVPSIGQNIPSMASSYGFARPHSFTTYMHPQPPVVTTDFPYQNLKPKTIIHVDQQFNTAMYGNGGLGQVPVSQPIIPAAPGFQAVSNIDPACYMSAVETMTGSPPHTANFMPSSDVAELNTFTGYPPVTAATEGSFHQSEGYNNLNPAIVSSGAVPHEIGPYDEIPLYEEAFTTPPNFDMSNDVTQSSSTSMESPVLNLTMNNQNLMPSFDDGGSGVSAEYPQGPATLAGAMPQPGGFYNMNPVNLQSGTIPCNTCQYNEISMVPQAISMPPNSSVFNGVTQTIPPAMQGGIPNFPVPCQILMPTSSNNKNRVSKKRQRRVTTPPKPKHPQVPEAEHKKRPRRKAGEIERIYDCNYKSCRKSYGHLHHLNTHIKHTEHGPIRHAKEFKEILEALKVLKALKELEELKKKEEEIGNAAL